MYRRHLLRAFTTTIIALFLEIAPSYADTAARPGVVFFLVDDLGWSDLGCYGSSFHETPSLDRLAASGMRFTDAYAACPVCSPTRAAIMTGKYPARLDITDWIPGQNPGNRRLLGPKDRSELPLEEMTLAEALAAHGYRTFFAGKWHLGGEGYLPENQGFAVNRGGHHRGSPPGGYYVPYRNPKLEDGPEGEYLTDRLTEESIRFLEQVVGASESGETVDPFLLYLSFYTVHTPIQACKRHLAHFEEKAARLPPLEGPAWRPEHDGVTKLRQDNAAYASMVRAMDENVGRVLDALERLDLSKSTIVVFTSDNGGLSTLARPRSPTSNLPLRAGKGWCYEGGIRVPLIIRAPGTTKAGSVCGVPVISNDFYPTLLELAGLPARPAQHRHGVSIAPLLRGAAAPAREALFWHYPHYHGSTWKPGAAVRAGSWKLIEFYDEEKVELYNLVEDIGESRNLAGEQRERRDQLLGMLHDWQEAMGAKMPTPNPAFTGKRGS